MRVAEWRDDWMYVTGDGSRDFERSKGSFIERQTGRRMSNPVPKRVSVVPVTVKPHAT
jgi:hypothetical protein